MKALKFGDKSLVKSPKLNLQSILGVAYLASSIHFFLQGITNLFLTQSTFPVPYHSFGLFLIPGALLTLHDAANNDYSRLSSSTYKNLNLMVFIFAGIKVFTAYTSIGFVKDINFIADLYAAFFSLVGLITGFVVKK